MTKSRIAGQLVCVLLLGLALIVSGTQGAYAQGATGQIKGIVTDTSGAVVPGAKVTITNLETGFTRVTVSGGDGSFLVPLLPPSHYKVEVLAQNFERLVRGPITVQVAEAADVGNLALTVGSQSTTVTVSGEAGQEALLADRDSNPGQSFRLHADRSHAPLHAQLLAVTRPAGRRGRGHSGNSCAGNGTSQYSWVAPECTTMPSASME